MPPVHRSCHRTGRRPLSAVRTSELRRGPPSSGSVKTVDSSPPMQGSEEPLKEGPRGCIGHYESPQAIIRTFNSRSPPACLVQTVLRFPSSLTGEAGPPPCVFRNFAGVRGNSGQPWHGVLRPLCRGTPAYYCRYSRTCPYLTTLDQVLGEWVVVGHLKLPFCSLALDTGQSEAAGETGGSPLSMLLKHVQTSRVRDARRSCKHGQGSVAYHRTRNRLTTRLPFHSQQGRVARGPLWDRLETRSHTRPSASVARVLLC